MITRALLNGILIAAFAGAPAIVGCEKTVYEKRTVKEKSDGSTVVEEKKTTESDDGDRKTTVERKEVDPD